MKNVPMVSTYQHENASQKYDSTVLNLDLNSPKTTWKQIWWFFLPNYKNNYKVKYVDDTASSYLVSNRDIFFTYLKNIDDFPTPIPSINLSESDLSEQENLEEDLLNDALLEKIAEQDAEAMSHNRFVDDQIDGVVVVEKENCDLFELNQISQIISENVTEEAKSKDYPVDFNDDVITVAISDDESSVFIDSQKHEDVSIKESPNIKVGTS